MEMVLTVDTSCIQDRLVGKDFSLIVENKQGLLQTIYSNYNFLKRDQIENDIRYRQIIPYCLLRFDDKFILFDRLKKQSERRLHSKLSIGAGGHINCKDIDPSPSRIIEKCILRELNEEIHVSFDISKGARYIGALNDELSDVSKSHLGLLYEIQLLNPAFLVKETKKMTAHWATIRDIASNYERLENWSKIAFDQYIVKTN